MRKRFDERFGRRHAGGLDLSKDRRLLHAQSNVQRNSDEEDRDDKRHAPAPRAERRARHRVLHDDADRERHEQSERRGDLNKTRVVSALFVGHMLGDVNSSAAILTTKRESLQHTDDQQNDRRGESDGMKRRQETDRGSRAAHDQQRHEKRIFASHEITDASEEERTKRTDDKTDSKRREISDERECVVAVRIEERRDYYCEAAEDVEVVPLDHGTDCGRGDYLPRISRN